MFLPPRPLPRLAGVTLGFALVHCAGSAPTPIEPSPLVAAAASATTTTTSTTCRDTSGGRGDTASVVAAALALRDALPEPQRASLMKPLTRASAIGWSNLPIGLVPRTGLRLGNLDPAQAAAARRLVAAAVSACGLTLFDEIRLADHELAAVDKRKIGWGEANYYVSLLGTPSAQEPWMLQIGGHHIAFNLTFNGAQAGATPLFFGAEPVRFTTTDGNQHEPLRVQSAAMATLATTLAMHREARLSGTFTDVVKGVADMGPPAAPGGLPSGGGTDTLFPQTYPTGAVDRGIRFAALSPDEQKRVRDALESYASLPGEALTRALVDAYESPGALGETYVGYSGTVDLATIGTYVRIDGPRVWMEFVVQPGRGFDKPHYHALWRDKVSDYGGEAKL